MSFVFFGATARTEGHFQTPSGSRLRDPTRVAGGCPFPDAVSHRPAVCIDLLPSSVRILDDDVASVHSAPRAAVTLPQRSIRFPSLRSPDRM